MLPDDNVWNQPIDDEPVDPRSDAIIARIGKDKRLHPDFGTKYGGKPMGFSYLVVPGNQPRIPVKFVESPKESDAGPYPIPLDAPIEGGADATGDRHVLVLDRDNWKLYELIKAFPQKDSWRADSGAVFDLNSNALRPRGWTSANAAGLPILPGLVRYDEVMEQGEIRHAVGFTCEPTRAAYVFPARHFASKLKDRDLPPMGMRVRLRKDVRIDSFPHCAQVILRALKKYGMLLAQNGGDWFMNGATDPRWRNAELSTLKRIRGQDFEIVQMGPIFSR